MRPDGARPRSAQNNSEWKTSKQKSGRLSARPLFLGLAVLLEQYFERELNLAFRLSGAGK